MAASMIAFGLLLLVVGLAALWAYRHGARRVDKALAEPDTLDEQLRQRIDGEPLPRRQACGCPGQEMQPGCPNAAARDEMDQAIALTHPPADPHRDDLGRTAAQRRAEVAALEDLLHDHTAQEG